MLSLTIIFSKEDKKLFFEFIEKLRISASDITSVSIANNDNNISVIVTYNRKTSKQAKEKIKKELAKSIASYFKKKYISENTSINLLDEMTLSALYTALTVFDSDSDIMEIENLIRIKKKFLVSSFYIFNMQSLKMKWQEICNLINENFRFSQEYQSLVELLRYLITMSESKADELVINKDDEYFYFSDKKGKEVHRPIKIEPYNENEVLSAVIGVSPKRICFKYKEQEDGKLENYLKEIFYEKIK